MAATPFPFALSGLSFDRVEQTEKHLTIFAHANGTRAACPACGQRSARVHSYYLRSPGDLPISGWPARLRLRVRRFRCTNSECSRNVFTERLPDVLPRRAASLRATHDSSCRDVPGCRLCSRRGGRSPPARSSTHADERGHAASDAPPHPLRFVNAAAARGRRRRLGLLQRTPLRHNSRRFGTPPPHRLACRPQGRDVGRVATCASRC